MVEGPEVRDTPEDKDAEPPSGEELRALRLHAGITQRELARRAGYSRGLVAEVERGRRPGRATRGRLADALHRIGGAEAGIKRDTSDGQETEAA